MSRARELILPFYLFLCLVLGGSSQAIWGNAVLQLMAVGILAWSLLAPDPQSSTVAGRRLLLIAGLGGLLFLLQLVPLPPAIWAALPGREFLVAGYELLGMALPWLPLSLAPYDTFATALTLLPPLALLVGMLRLRTWNSSWMLAAVALGAGLSVVLGILQVGGGGESWYWYRRTNVGVAVGTFANGNHFATLLLAAIPLVAALVTARWRSARKQSDRSMTIALGLAAAAVIAIGMLINGSAAMLLLGPPVIAATALMVMRLPQKRVRQGMMGVGALLMVATAAVALAGEALPSWGTSASIATRVEYWSQTLRATADNPVTGSGFGTFRKVYNRSEDPGAVDRWYANHAHNEYLELLLEGGVPAVMVLLIFLLWWIRQAADSWRSASASLERQAASIAVAAILLHSLFDFPLRTAAIAGVFAVCLGLLAGARGVARTRESDEPEDVRHATL